MSDRETLVVMNTARIDALVNVFRDGLLNEAIIATLMAYRLTGDQKYTRWFEQALDWSYKHFADPVHGEWFGYLHRDGRILHDAKGTMWKGPFHLPRMQLVCWQLLEQMRREVATNTLARAAAV